MDISFSLQERLSQQLTLSPQMLQSIRILNLGIVDLHAFLISEIEKNPLIDFPSTWEPRSCGSGLIENITRADAPSLRDDLRFQLHVSCIEKQDLPIGEFIIDCIDERGYLCEKIADLAEHLNIPEQRIHQVVALIRTFEPAGVGATSLAECLAIQLQVLHQDNPCVMTIVNSHLDDLARNKIGAIAKKTGYTRDQILEAAQIIQSLNLYPGENYGEDVVRTIVPEVLVSVENGSVAVRLTNELPVITLNDSLTSLTVDDEEAANYVQQELNKARWLMHCIDQRSSTLLQVATSIIHQQQQHFLAATPPLPLTLEQIASDLAINPSTVSRAISERYYEFNRQVYAFKDLFPSRLKSGESDAHIKQEIQRLIQSEDRRSPLSDQQISDILKSKQIVVARRTIAKYRTEMNIEPACRRK